jgi:hypothetical protein
VPGQWTFDPQTKRWTEESCTGAPPCARASHGLVCAGDGVTLAVVGGGGDEGPIFDLHLLDILSRTWSQLLLAPTTAPAPREMHSCFCLPPLSSSDSGVRSTRRYPSLLYTGNWGGMEPYGRKCMGEMHCTQPTALVRGTRTVAGLSRWIAPPTPPPAAGLELAVMGGRGGSGLIGTMEPLQVPASCLECCSYLPIPRAQSPELATWSSWGVAG